MAGFMEFNPWIHRIVAALSAVNRGLIPGAQHGVITATQWLVVLKPTHYLEYALFQAGGIDASMHDEEEMLFIMNPSIIALRLVRRR